MADIYDPGSNRSGEPPQDGPPRTRNREILAEIEAMAKANDTPEARLVSELRGMEETLRGNHRRYAELWQAADRLGITPPVRTASRIVAEATASVQASRSKPPLLPTVSAGDDAPEAASRLLTEVCLPLSNISDSDPPSLTPEQQPPPAPQDMREYSSLTAAILADPQAFRPDSGPSNDQDHGPERGR